MILDDVNIIVTLCEANDVSEVTGNICLHPVQMLVLVYSSYFNTNLNATNFIDLFIIGRVITGNTALFGDGFFTIFCRYI